MRIKLAVIGALIIGLNCSQVALPAFAAGNTNSTTVTTEQAQKKLEFGVVGNSKGAYYKQILGEYQGSKVQINIKKIPSYANIGGIMIEQDPTFKINGNFGPISLDFDVKAEDLISNVGGINVETGVVYHITGKLSGKAVEYRIDEKEKIDNVGGLNVQTAVWNVLTNVTGNKVELSFQSVSEVSNVGGLNVETNRYNTLTGNDPNGLVNFKIDGFSSDSIQLKGNGSAESIALLLALRPFLNV
ncbi:MAG: hypothetical protein HQM08_10410 [Candidatus Riflebacteria bacterium]|nr:hypothetical protein [Candidatus Riflebacteria bacterium]